METRVTIKGQIGIPASLRRKYGIRTGTRIIISERGDEIVLKPITEQYVERLKGSLKGSRALEVLMKERRKDRVKEQ